MKGNIKWLLFKKGIFTELRAKKNKWQGNMFIGKNFSIGKNSILDRYLSGNMNIGNDVHICKSCKIATCGGDLCIGNGTTIGDYTTITAQGGVNIGSNVLFADHVSLIANEHNYMDIKVPIMKQGCTKRHIEIGDGTWIGINATIIGNTKVGKNCVIAAGAVVKGNFPDNVVIAGIPARIIKQYSTEKDAWI